jgi:predicted solute-binding protein
MIQIIKLKSKKTMRNNSNKRIESILLNTRITKEPRTRNVATTEECASSVR